MALPSISVSFLRALHRPLMHVRMSLRDSLLYSHALNVETSFRYIFPTGIPNSLPNLHAVSSVDVTVLVQLVSSALARIQL